MAGREGGTVTTALRYSCSIFVLLGDIPVNILSIYDPRARKNDEKDLFLNCVFQLAGDTPQNEEMIFTARRYA